MVEMKIEYILRNTKCKIKKNIVLKYHLKISWFKIKVQPQKLIEYFVNIDYDLRWNMQYSDVNYKTF